MKTLSKKIRLEKFELVKRIRERTVNQKRFIVFYLLKIRKGENEKTDIK